MLQQAPTAHFTGNRLALQGTLWFSVVWLARGYSSGAKTWNKKQLFFVPLKNACDSDPSVSTQPPARTCPAASKENALRPLGTTPAPVTLDSMDRSVNMVSQLFC